MTRTTPDFSEIGAVSAIVSLASLAHAGEEFTSDIATEERP